MTSVQEMLEERQNEILKENYKLHSDSDSGITWYEDDDEDAAFDRAVSEIEQEMDEELGIMSFIVTLDGDMYTKRIRNIDKIDKKNLAVIFQGNKIVYKNQYFRMLLSAM